MPEEDKDKVILKVDMHCEACKASVRKSLRDVPGLENIEINMKEQKVTVKGKVDARKVFDRVRKKSGRRTELLFPQLPKKDIEIKKKEEVKKEEAPEISVVLKVKMHCGGCAKEVMRSLKKIDGVSSVKVDMDAEKVIVNGRNIDPSKISQRLVKNTGKHVEIVPPPPPPPQKKEASEIRKEEKKEEKPAEEEKKEVEPAAEEKKEEKPAEEQKNEEKPAEEEKKEEKPEEEKKEEKPAEEKTEEQPADGAQEKREETPAEEKAEEKKEEAKDEKEEGPKQEASSDAATEADSEQQEGDDDGKSDLKRFEYTPMRSIPEYVYPPQLFSDENPNACSIM